MSTAQQSYVFLTNIADPKYREEYSWLRNSGDLQGNDHSLAAPAISATSTTGASFGENSISHLPPEGLQNFRCPGEGNRWPHFGAERTGSLVVSGVGMAVLP